MTTERLIREYVRQVLQEDEGYGAVMNAAADMNPYGMSFGSNDDLYKIFVKPFTDVIDTAAGKTKEISQKAQTVMRVAFEAVATSLIPVLKDSYGEVFKHEAEAMEKIEQQYGAVYKSNWDAFKDNDVLFLSFCCDPTKFVTQQLVKKSPKAAIKMISVLTGGTLDKWLAKVKKQFGLDKADQPVKTGLDNDTRVTDVNVGHDVGFSLESVIREDGENKPSLTSVLSNPKLIEKLQQSDVAQKLSQQATAIARGTLEQVYKQAKGVMTAQSLQDLQHKTGAKLKGMDKLAEVPQQERQKAEQTMLTGAKKGMKEFYVKGLEGQVKKAIDGGAPPDSSYVQDYQRVIAKLKAL
jgi:hypothetical protein